VSCRRPRGLPPAAAGRESHKETVKTPGFAVGPSLQRPDNHMSRSRAGHWHDAGDPNARANRALGRIRRSWPVEVSTLEPDS
jgi:hypothetical protein